MRHTLMSYSICHLLHAFLVLSLQRGAGAHQPWSEAWWFPGITDQHRFWDAIYVGMWLNKENLNKTI